MADKAHEETHMLSIRRTPAPSWFGYRQESPFSDLMSVLTWSVGTGFCWLSPPGVNKDRNLLRILSETSFAAVLSGSHFNLLHGPAHRGVTVHKPLHQQGLSRALSRHRALTPGSRELIVLSTCFKLQKPHPDLIHA